ncbi:hypothetical protein VTJ04DRAFT_6357 [Mycothermus thermophilus]|uniref:uncharacterized protein n=1 Tax=Humicola insolens TaxID=85995 RepID=UPI0037448C00
MVFMSDYKRANGSLSSTIADSAQRGCWCISGLRLRAGESSDTKHPASLPDTISETPVTRRSSFQPKNISNP